MQLKKDYQSNFESCQVIGHYNKKVSIIFLFLSFPIAIWGCDGVFGTSFSLAKAVSRSKFLKMLQLLRIIASKKIILKR